MACEDCGRHTLSAGPRAGGKRYWMGPDEETTMGPIRWDGHTLTDESESD